MTNPGLIVDPIDIGKVAKPPYVRLPDLKRVFTHRTDRLADLARESRMGDFLSFIAELARAQATALERLPAGFLPEMARAGELPLDRSSWPRDPSWRHALATILEQMGRTGLTPETRQAIEALKGLDGDMLEALAGRAALFEGAHLEPAKVCFLVAALQVCWTRMAGLLDPDGVKRVERVGVCPVCGAPPVASVVYSTGVLTGTRFLVCALCATEWHLVRIKCANCDSTKGIAYHEIEGSKGSVKAETCDECRTYTKILYMEKDSAAEPFADDLASLGLDLLVNEAGWRRAKPNPFLIPGAG